MSNINDLIGPFYFLPLSFSDVKGVFALTSSIDCKTYPTLHIGEISWTKRSYIAGFNETATVLYTHLPNSMNERNTSLWKYKSYFILEKGPSFVVSWEIDGETYTQGEDFFFPYFLPEARGCQRLHPLASQDSSDQLRFPRSTRFSALSLNMIAWFSSRGLLPVTYL